MNIRGQIIGINTAIVGESFRGISFAIPSKAAREIYGKLIAEGKVARAWLGVGLEKIDEDVAKELGVTGGVVITRLVPNSPATLAGLRPGDIIVEWAGQPVGEPMELTLQVGGTEIGAEVTVGYFRDGQRRSVKVKLGQRPDDLQLRR